MYLLFYFLIILQLINSFVFNNLPKIHNQIHYTIKMNLVDDIDIINTNKLNWYVVGEANKIQKNKLYKTTVWAKNYVYWKDDNEIFYAMDDDCSHRGASLGLGYLKNNCVICPYHGYEFDRGGKLCVVPGLNFTNSECQNQITYNIVEKNGWIFLNTIKKKNQLFDFNDLELFEEQEAKNKSYSPIFLNVMFNAYGRIVSENSLDVMHIGYVHTFGNKERPSPITEVPPFEVNDYPNHYKTIYTYISGKDSIAKKIYNKKKLTIENEFVLPHTTIARVIFGDLVSTVVTFATPINISHTCLYVKTYRNFWYKRSDNIVDKIVNKIGDYFSEYFMMKTVLEDRIILENININKIDGKFNMKYDKLQNVYKQLYKKLIHNNNPTNK